MPFTIEDLRGHIDVEHSHAAFIADFPSFAKEDQSAAIRLLASPDVLEVFGFNVEEEWQEAEMERMELLGHLCEKLKIPGPTGTLAKFAATEMIGAAQEGDIVDVSNAEEVTGREDLFALALAIADLHSPAPVESPTSARDAALVAAIGNRSGFDVSALPFPGTG